MQRTLFPVILVFVFFALCNGIAATNEKVETDNLRALKSRHTLRNSKWTSEIGGDVSNFNSGESEERGLSATFVSKVQSVFGKNSGITNKIASMRGNPEVTAALEKSPVVKKLETAAVNDPNFVNTLKKDPALVKKLHKDPEVAKVTASLEKKNIHFSKDDIKQLRAAIAKAKEPAKAGKLENLLDVLDKMMTLVVKASFATLIFLLVLTAVAYVTHST